MRILAGFLMALTMAVGLAPAASPAQELDADTMALISRLPDGSYNDRASVVSALAATGNAALVPLLQALDDGNLYVLDADGSIVLGIKKGRDYEISDPVTGEDRGTIGTRDADKIKVNNGLRRVIGAALGQMTLMSPDRRTRFAAAEAVLKSADADSLELIDTALAAETDAGIAALLEQARSIVVIRNDFPLADKQAAIDTLAEKADRNAMAILKGALAEADAELAPLLQKGVTAIEGKIAAWSAVQNVWYGVSLGSVLLLAAIGLAITFGVMGVINMAHGEIVMLGAYTTFVVQEVIRNNYPGLFDYSLAIALPLAFLVAGLAGVAIERGIIRFLYGRPLETLLATWGLSLILQQAVRTMFGPNNREVGNPSWMSGTVDFLGLAITWNRLWIVVFALVVFAILLLVFNRTPLGLQMRAVTQNRRMASAMGIRTPYVDALTFGLGSGIAGIAGVALSQIDNVSPNLGQSYIVDSFMVVVFGGVGNLWGTLVGAMTLGIANKFLEPYAGAVLGKILILVFIILFIQRRPRGLFALKGRAVEQ